MSFFDHLQSVLAGFGLAVEGKGVLGLSVRDLVITEPHEGVVEQIGQLRLNVINIVQLRSQRIVHVDANDFPISFPFVNQSESSQDLHFLDLASDAQGRANFANVDGVVVTFAASVRVDSVRVLPGLRQSAIIPIVPVSVRYISELPVLDILKRFVKRKSPMQK
jgi:hypothetical protein